MKKIALIALFGLMACQNSLDLQADKSMVTQFAGQSPAIGINPPTVASDCDQIVDAQMLEDILVQADIIQAGLTLGQPAGADYCQVNFLLTANAAALAVPATAVDAQVGVLVDTVYGALIKSSYIAATGGFAIQSIAAINLQGVDGIGAAAQILDNQAVVAASKTALLSSTTEPSFLLFEKF